MLKSCILHLYAVYIVHACMHLVMLCEWMAVTACSFHLISYHPQQRLCTRDNKRTLTLMWTVTNKLLQSFPLAIVARYTFNNVFSCVHPNFLNYPRKLVSKHVTPVRILCAKCPVRYMNKLEQPNIKKQLGNPSLANFSQAMTFQC